MAKSKSAASAGKITQRAMVEAAIHEKGWEAGPRELQTVIKDKYNYDMPVNYISNYKSQIKKAAGKGGGKRGRKGGLQFSDLETVCGLVDRLGADQVKKLVDMANMFA